ncbi:MAG: hypothetical protein QG551_113 [Patescibacteria group bacterium]|jgi:hypothetical protein|nr:hypothetical protein [Patescibacteria group bacterium]
MTITTYTREQFAEAVSYLYIAATGQDQTELLQLQQSLLGIPEEGHVENLAHNATLWAGVVEKRIPETVCLLPEVKACLQELIKRLRATPLCL